MPCPAQLRLLLIRDAGCNHVALKMTISISSITLPSLLSNHHFPNPIFLRFPSKSQFPHSPAKLSPYPHLTFRAKAPLNSTQDESPTWFQVAATSAVLLLTLATFRVFPAASSPLPPAFVTLSQDDSKTQGDDAGGNSDVMEKFEDEELKAAFEAWKSKTYALSVPLRVVALRGSIPPSWAKEFGQSQGRRLRFNTKFVGSLENIFSDLSGTFAKKAVGPTSTVAADIVSVGDSWLNFAITNALIEPMREVEDQDWFKGLNEKWKVYLRRNNEGEIDPGGKIWAAPYRWGCMVIAYKKSKFKKYKLAPIEDWADLWRRDLTGKISMVDSLREVVGAVLKYMGASYNTKNIDLEVSGGRNAIQKNLELLRKQVRLFDSTHYLKAFGVGDTWVAVGWSSDVIPVAMRMSNVAVIVPKSGASLWADLWAIPATSRLQTSQIGGRIRGPSLVIHQWIEFCLQAARALPFKQGVIPGAVPSFLGNTPIVEVPPELTKGKPRLDTNLVAGVPPPEILSRCEFLEPLSDVTLSDYKFLVASLQNSSPGLIHRMRNNILSAIQTFWQKAQA